MPFLCFLFVTNWRRPSTTCSHRLWCSAQGHGAKQLQTEPSETLNQNMPSLPYAVLSGILVRAMRKVTNATSYQNYVSLWSGVPASIFAFPTICFLHRSSQSKLGMVAHAHNPCTQEAKADGSWVQGQPVLHNKTPSLKKGEKRQPEWFFNINW
jgi:hypothetical protein